LIRLVSTKRINAMFLAIILVTGTIAAISPSFIIKGVNAQSEPYYEKDTSYSNYEQEPKYLSEHMDKGYSAYEPDYPKYPDKKYNNYGPEYPPKYTDDRKYNSYTPDYYGMDNNYDKKSYGYEPKYQSYGGKDGRDYDKSKKDDNNKVEINKIKCINTNLNINGNNAGNVSIGNKGQGYLGGYSSGGGGYYGEGYGKQGKGFDCIINNNNNNIAGGGNQTTTKATLNVSKIVTCTYLVGGLAPETACAMLEERITENQFLIEVTDDNPIPSQFPGSESGTIVTLGAGNYVVSETPDVASIQSDIDFLENEFEVLSGGGTEYEITGPFPSFTGDCSSAVDFEATGTIGGGESQTCEIENHFDINITL
jgi:hypothetical protein